MEDRCYTLYRSIKASALFGELILVVTPEAEILPVVDTISLLIVP